MKRPICIFFATLFTICATLYAEQLTCNIESGKIILRDKDSDTKLELSDAYDCIVLSGNILVARGIEGIDVYKLSKEKGLEKISNIKTYGEVIRFKVEGQGIYAVSAAYSYFPINISADGNVSILSFTNELLKRETVVSTPTTLQEKPLKQEIKKLEGKVIEVTPGYAIINLGSKDGIEKGMRFEILSSELKKTYNLKTKSFEMMPSLEQTAVSPVVQVSEDKCMIRIGRGNRAYVGDIALLTEKPLSESLFTPSYEKDLQRVYGRIAPFIGVETLTIGTLMSLMYDYTFSFPLKIEAGISNAGILFSTDNTSPFQIDVIPSYNTDLFEVGVGTGYSYSGHELQRNFLFMQKVRLGAIDGLSFTMRNSFIYQEKHSSWSFVGADVASGGVNKEGDPCDFGKEAEYEFAWNSLDMEISTPVSKSVNLFTHWAYSQAGWFSGEIGIKNFVRGNGGDGTLIIPVSIGGAAVFDYKKRKSHSLVCNPETNKMEYEKEWDEEGFGGPIVSIGIDYRWK